MLDIKNVYSNGSSLTAGGGLYEPGIKNEYKRLYGIEWDNEKDVTYPKYVADHFNLNLTHDAECGSGAPRLVRRTYEHIEKIGIDEAKKTIFLFEITDPMNRIDMYCEKVQSHIIVNARYNESGGIENLSAVHSYSPTNRKDSNDIFIGEIESEIKDYLTKYHNPVIYSDKFVGDLVGLFSFLEKMKIPFFYMFENDYLRNPFIKFYNEMDREHRIFIENGCTSSSHFCIFNKLTIKDELNDFTGDTHPGYYGYKKFANVVIANIQRRLFDKEIIY